MCERWRKNWKDFLTDVGYRPTSKYTLERQNNDGHYEPGNVVWATWHEQKLNSTSGPKRLDLTGLHFGLLTALYAEPKQPKRMTHWVCRCDCGTTCSASLGGLRNGRTTNCGCQRRNQFILPRVSVQL